ncbi:MAG: malto-oligosyltrehalose synthase, partial [Dehalococcoidia bacterium]|nr:malto-oligosyltrehalose synthase [Dehalococcoidia bacterium]
VPLWASGTKGAHICAFAWQRSSQELIVVVPRLIFGLVGNAGMTPTGSQVWEDSCLILPDRLSGQRYRNIFTGEMISATPCGREKGLSLAEVFSLFPVAVLEKSD